MKEENNTLQKLNVSDNLKKYLNLQILFKEKGNFEITDKDVDKVLEKFKRINKERTNQILIPADISMEFIDLIKEKAQKRKIDLGIIEIDIMDKDFSIKGFVENAKNLSYSLRLKIKSIKDIKNEERDFLESRYGIIYVYSGNYYHIDELYSITTKIKSLLSENEETISVREKNQKRAQNIADVVFKNIKLYVPSEYRLEEKEILLRNGEILPLPNFRVLEDTSHFANLINIFVEKTADFKGMRRLCKECLRIDGYEMIERVSEIGNMVGTEFVIDNKEYGIDVTTKGIKIVEINRK